MNLEYAIFRTEPINNLNDLAQIGSHNQRKKKAYKSNPDIDMELSINNIDLVPLNETYVNGFYELTKEYKKEHDERMKTEREDRKKTFREMVNKSKSVVADELLFTATSTFFEGMDKECKCRTHSSGFTHIPAEMIENIRGRSATLSSNANRLDKLEFYMKVIGTITVALILSLSGVALKHIFG